MLHIWGVRNGLYNNHCCTIPSTLLHGLCIVFQGIKVLELWAWALCTTVHMAGERGNVTLRMPHCVPHRPLAFFFILHAHNPSPLNAAVWQWAFCVLTFSKQQLTQGGGGPTAINLTFFWPGNKSPDQPEAFKLHTKPLSTPKPFFEGPPCPTDYRPIF